jgi:hypothetical protein
MPKKKTRQKIRTSDPVLCSAVRFATESGLGLSLVRELLANGELPFKQLRQRRWILRSEALASLRKQTKLPARAPQKVQQHDAEIRAEA